MKDITTTLGIVRSLILKNFLNILFLVLSLFSIILEKKNMIPRTELIFLDVGQGDAILIQRDNFQILIDGGPDDNLLYELAKYMPWYDKTIEKVILTHPHDDHLSGIMVLLKKYIVEEVLYYPISYDNVSYSYLQEEYSNKLKEVKAGDYVQYQNIFLSIISPLKSSQSKEVNINNESIVLYIVIDGYKVLLMGDAEVEIEEKLLDYPFIQGIDILKVGHHCSKTSSSKEFISFTQPNIAICSCGSHNRFGHPHYETIEKFKNMSVQHFITYEEGSIKFTF